MPKVKVTTPVKGFTGVVGGVDFAKGEATVDTAERPAAMAYFRRHGYEIAPLDEAEMPEGDGGGQGEPEAPKLPARSASKADWVAYALTQGLDEAEAEAMTRDALAERFTDTEKED